MFPLESCTGASFCTRTRTGIAISGPEYLYPDQTDTFKNMKNFSKKFDFLKYFDGR
jgi:hypothetical protein